MAAYFLALHAEDGRDPLRSERGPAQQTVRPAVAARRLLDIVQAAGETPENT